MKSKRGFDVGPLIVFIVALALAQLACGSSTSEELASSVPPTAAPQQATESAPVEAPTEQSGPADTPQPTAVPATPTSPPEPINLVAQGFGQDGQEVGFAFIVENPNAAYAIENSQFQIAAYDANDVVVETESSYINLLLPGERLGVGGTFYVNEGVTVARIETQLNAGDPATTDLSTAFTVDKVVYRTDDMRSQALGIVTNPFDRDITELRVSAVAFNDVGEIVGGGFTFLNFILAKGTTGVTVPVTGAGPIAKVELYPTVSGLSMLTTPEDLPEGAQDVLLVKQGYGQDGMEVGYGALVQNPNTGFAVESTMYHVNLFTEDGSILSTDQGYIATLLPGQTLGICSEAYVDQELTAASGEMQIMTGRFEATDALPTFTVENIAFLPDDYFPKATGEIVSPYTKDITNVRVTAIAYNEAGDIIGSGFTYVEFVPANGRAAVEVSIVSAATPAKVELYAAVSALSDFE